MDELKQVWEEYKKEHNNLTDFSESEININISSKSKSTMQKLKKKVLIKFILCLIFTLLLGAFIPFAYPLPSQFLLLILLIAYIIGDILFYQEYKELGKVISMDQDLLMSMKTVRDRIRKVNKYEELIGLVLYPFSATAGFMIGLTIEDKGAYLDRPIEWIALVISILIITPLAHWLAKWMNKKAFGNYLERLDENIIHLEKVEG